MKLTPADVEKIETKNLANIIRKANSEKTLTSTELRILAEAKSGELQTPGSAAPNFVSKWDDLAKALTCCSDVSITRRAIQEWRKDPRYAAECPQSRADGRHDVSAWLAFMVRFGLKRADEQIASEDESEDGDAPNVIQVPRIAGCAADWNKAVAQKEYEKREIAIAQLRGTLLVASELELPLGATFSVIQTKLSQFPERAAKRVTGFTDVQEVEARLREEIDADLSDLNAAKFLDQSLTELVNALPFDTETERLFKLVSFDGQDRAGLLELIALVAHQALCALGRRALLSAAEREKIADARVVNAATGQITDEAATANQFTRATSDPVKSAPLKRTAKKLKLTRRRKA